MFSKLAYAMIENGYVSHKVKIVSQLISIVDFKTWYEYSCLQN